MSAQRLSLAIQPTAGDSYCLRHDEAVPRHRRAGDRRRRTAARALAFAGALGGFAQSLAGAAGALLAERVGGSVAVAGLPQTLLVVGAAISAVLLGRVARDHGRGPALALGTGLALVGCGAVVLAGILDSLAGIVVGSTLLGSGNTAVMLGRYAGADLAPEHARGTAMGSILAATTVGAVAGPHALAPANRIADAAGLPGLLGAYVIAAVAFAAATAVLLIGLSGVGGAPSAPYRPERARGRVDASVRLGVGVLAVANLVMVSVMTMAPIHLHHGGTGLGVIGAIVSLHIAGMFAPSPFSGRLADRWGPRPVVILSAGVLAAACVLAASAATVAVLSFALVLLGIGWNLALVGGSVLLTAGAPEHERPRREAWGEVGMGIAAAVGGLCSGLVVGVAGYPVLALGATAVALLAGMTFLRRPAVARR